MKILDRSYLRQLNDLGSFCGNPHAYTFQITLVLIFRILVCLDLHQVALECDKEIK